MKYTGIKFFMDLVDVEYDQLLAAFSFYSGFDSSNVVYPEKWSGSNSATGYLNTINSSFYSSGTGRFNGSLTMSLSGQNFALTEDSTLLLSFQKLRTGNEILLSSTTGNNFNNYQGYCLGVNDANKLYFKYWNPVEGAFTFTYSKILSDKNLIVLNRTNSVLTIGRYDNNNFEYDLEEFFIYENAFKNNEYGNLFLGGSRNNFDWANNGARNFSGYIDKFYFFNNTPFNYRNILTSGLYSVATGYDGLYETYCYDTGFYTYSGFSYTGQTGVFVSGFSSGITGVTGYVTGISGYSYSGITGYSGKYLGTLFDNCGVPKDLYEQVPVSGSISGNYSIVIPLTGTLFITGAIDVPLTGFITGSGLISVTGEVCDTIFTLTGKALYDIDTNYLSSLSYSEISLLSNVIEKDIVEIYYSPYQNETKNINVDLAYDNIQNNFYSKNFNINDKNILLFAQGQALSSSGGQLLESGYERIPTANLDYFITGDRVEVNKNFNESNQLFYDYYKDREKYYIVNKSNYNTGETIFVATNSPNTGLLSSFIFKNGQKLLSGIDYQTDSFITLMGSFTSYTLPSTLSNHIITLNNSTGSIYRTGNFNNPVRFILPDNDKFLIGGDFTQYNNINCNQIVRIFAENGNIDTSFSGSISGGVCLDAVKYNNKYLVCGTFTGVNDISQGYITCLNSDGSVDTSFIPPGGGTDATINKIYINNQNDIYIVGSFTVYNNDTINRIAKLNSNGILDKNFNSGNSFNNSINDICLVSDNTIIIAGAFSTINGSGQFRRIARMDLNGNIISNFNSGFTATVNTVTEDKNNNIIIGGNFTGYGNNPIERAERFIVLDKNENISPLYNAITGFSSQVRSIIVQNNNKILVGGDFVTFKSINYPRILRLNSDYTIDTTFTQPGQGLNNTVLNILSYDAVRLKISGSGGNDIFMAKEYPLDFQNFSGSSGFLNIPINYNNKSSLVFFNGIRQKLNNNYVENSKLDLLSGTFFETSSPKNIIYNNTDDFFV